MRIVHTARRIPTYVGRFTAALFMLVLVACGGGDGDSDGGTDAPADAGDTTAAPADTGSTDDATSSDSGGAAMATLTVGDEVYTWAAEDMGTCEIGGIFPANADFGVPPSQGGEGPWVQFLDRGDGGINFSAVLDGEEYSGTGSGEADEIRPDGFTYTGSMGSGGERFDVELDVQC